MSGVRGLCLKLLCGTLIFILTLGSCSLFYVCFRFVMGYGISYVGGRCSSHVDICGFLKFIILKVTVSRVDGICILMILLMGMQHLGLVVIGFWMMMGSDRLGCEGMEGIVGFTGKIAPLLARENGGVIHGIPITTRVFHEMHQADHIV